MKWLSAPVVFCFLLLPIGGSFAASAKNEPKKPATIEEVYEGTGERPDYAGIGRTKPISEIPF